MINKKLVVGNWKMNPATLDEAKHIAQKVKRIAKDLNHTDVVVCPPFIFVQAVNCKDTVPHYHVGAQVVSFEESGSHTGEVSALMLKDAGVEYVIIGHSEMRANGESDEAVSKRIVATLMSGMIPILCIGEKSRDESGSHFDFVKEQIKNSLANVPKSKSSQIILAYEPVWAVGASEAMKPEDIYEMSLFVKKVFADIYSTDVAHKIDVLYGGAVTFRNALEIMKIGQVDGLLVGRESVNITGFIELLKVVDSV